MHSFATTTPTATSSPDRILGLDLARGLAILGMIVVNFKTGLAFGKEGPAWLLIPAGLLDGRAAATFVVLAGVGLSLMSRRARKSTDPEPLARVRRLLWRRSAVLFVGGMFFTLIWPADILHYYGVYIAIGALLLAAGDRVLLAAAGSVMMTFPALLLIFDYERGWDWATLTYVDLWTPLGALRGLFFNGFHPVFPWLAFLIFGLWLGRRDLKNRSTRRSMIALAAVVALVVESISFICVRATTEILGREMAAALMGSQALPPMPFYILAGAATAVVVIGLSIELQEKYADSWACHSLVATGQLALSHYIAHVIVGFGGLEALGLLTKLSFVEAIQWAMLYCLFTVIVSVTWRSRFPRGPFEWLLRAVDPRPSVTQRSSSLTHPDPQSGESRS